MKVEQLVALGFIIAGFSFLAGSLFAIWMIAKDEKRWGDKG